MAAPRTAVNRESVTAAPNHSTREPLDWRQASSMSATRVIDGDGHVHEDPAAIATVRPVLEGKVAIVTGAGSPIGLGRAMALAMLEAGARVAFLDVNGEQLRDRLAEARQVGGADCALAVVADVSKPDDAERSVQQTLA